MAAETPFDHGPRGDNAERSGLFTFLRFLLVDGPRRDPVMFVLCLVAFYALGQIVRNAL